MTGPEDTLDRSGGTPPLVPPPVPPKGSAKVQRPKELLRPGVLLAWAGVVVGSVGLVVMGLHVGGQGGWWIVLGVYGHSVDMGFIVAGISLACLGLVLSIWALIVAITHKSRIHVLCAVGLVICLAGLIRGDSLYKDRLPDYEKFQEAMEIMQQTTSQPDR